MFMNNKIKRHFYNGEHYLINEENKTVEILPEFYQKLKQKKLWNKFGFKKIGGSSIGDVLLVDQYKSQFIAFCRMMWIGIPILDRKYVDAGIAIEPKVINVIEKISKKSVETFDPVEYNYDFFSDKDDVVGGLPDGFIKEDNLLIEIKTTGIKNFEKWEKWGIPAAYHKQAQLYSYLMGAKKYAIVATFLEEEDYLNPSEFPINKRMVKSWKFDLDITKTEDDIKKVKEWYYQFTNQRISPSYDLKVDSDMLEWLKPRNANEWEELKNKWIMEGKIQ
ncbi:MAG: YqaJ viral recombinase family protein [Mycoplasmatales bacterium]|nr:YqaJ viral recombinase family protein [Mycoplasmatales bacterium]